MDVTAPASRAALSDPAAAFERLFLAEYARVVSIAHRVLADGAAAEDVAQEVFADFHRRHRPDATWAGAWLHRAAVHTALNALRSGRRRGTRESREANERRSSAVNPEQMVLEAERLALVRAALGRLPERTATILALRYSALSYAAVAAAIGVSANSVGTLLRRAEEAFRKEVGDALDPD